ncbi:hypothetical protein JKP88DRAFT_248149 [Tribonema minus]|uniref:Uncharacterized protein n=1 Tax=Tribonema minus TaxID=303371 RepID=A0A836CAG7_9STRA|nr:hypothetical protein JKP88DRAFT_248149 [Tribonema minus]
MANGNNALCDEDHIRQLLMVVASGVNRLREQHPWLEGCLKETSAFAPSADGGTNAQQAIVQPHVETELENADQIMTGLKAAYASSGSLFTERFADRLEPMLDFVHGGVMSLRACVRHHASGQAELKTAEKEQLCRQPSTPGFDEDTHDARRPSQRRHLAAPTPPATASAVLASEPGKAVWQMLGRGYWLTMASDRKRFTLLNKSPRAMVQVGRAELSCDMIRDAMDAGLLVDGHVLVGAAERGCEAALDQWHHSLSQRPAWRVQRSWVLSAMALRAIGVRERPEALQVVRWVFNTAVLKGAEVQLPPLLLTMLAFKCARYGQFNTFRWLYTEGRMLAEQGIAANMTVEDVTALCEEVFVPLRAAKQGEQQFIKFSSGESTSFTLMDSAIHFGQESFVVALSRFDVAPKLSSFTPHSVRIAARFASLGLLQWLHTQPACLHMFDGKTVILASMISSDPISPGAGDDAIEHSATEQLIWLRSTGALQTLTQQHLQHFVGAAAAAYAQNLASAHHAHARIQWLQDEMGADWPSGGAAYILQKAENLDACGVVRMVSDLACPWGPWTSAECALVRSRSQQRSSAPPQSVQHWMHQLHALGCPCRCAGAEDA